MSLDSILQNCNDGIKSLSTEPNGHNIDLWLNVLFRIVSFLQPHGIKSDAFGEDW